MSNPIKDRIRKLLNLANNSGATEAEATAAMEMASALMLKYNIEVDPETDELKTIRGSKVLAGYDEPWHITCSAAAAMLYSCINIVHSRGEYGYSFVGRPENVEMAGELMLFIVDQVEQLYKQYLPKGLSKADRAEFRRTFKQACAMRVYNRAFEIMEQFKNNDAKALEYTGSRALVVVESIKQQLDEARDFIAKEMPDVKDLVERPKKYGSGTRAGIEAGNKVELNRKIRA